MPVLFTLDLPTHDEAEAERLASVVREVRCDVHSEPPTKVRLTSRSSRHRSLFTAGCCPQLYLDVTHRLAQEGLAPDGVTERPVPVPSAAKRRLPTVV